MAARRGRAWWLESWRYVERLGRGRPVVAHFFAKKFGKCMGLERLDCQLAWEVSLQD